MADEKQAGPGRRAGSAATEPDREGMPNRFPGQGPSPARNATEGKPGLDQGAQAGAHGHQPPHQDVRPGTKLDPEQTDRDA